MQTMQMALLLIKYTKNNCCTIGKKLYIQVRSIRNFMGNNKIISDEDEKKSEQCDQEIKMRYYGG